MESGSKFARTEIHKRNGHNKAWKGITINKSVLSLTICALILLLCVKLVISGLYLRMGPIKLSGSKLAMAEESKTKPDQALEEKEMMLRKKEQELNEREDRIDKRVESLLPLQKEIDTKFEELNELQNSLTAYAKQLADKEKALKDTKIGHLVALYSAMEPARAAVIMDQLDINIIVRIMANMKGKSAGKILAAMAPEKGAMISEKLCKMD